MEGGGGGGGGGGDERTFRANFSGEGVARLRERVKEKLRELMGDYSDDTLAEYVVVLLRNGRRKDEAAKELQVFLGDDNVAFVSWLWDHLSSNLHLYVQPIAATTNDEAKSNHSSAGGLLVENKSSRENLTGSVQNDPKPESETETNQTPSIRQRREWGGIVREESQTVLLQSVVADFSRAEEKTFQKSHTVRRSRSPKMHHHRKRSREEDARLTKRISSSHPVIDAPLRLLQFAVRDAVRTVQPTTSSLEPASKRLRSVLSTLTSDSTQHGILQRRNSDVRVPGATAALRAAAEAAEDVVKGRSSGSVFDRLSSRRHTMAANESLDFGEQDLEEIEHEDIDHVPATNQENYRKRNQYDENFSGDANMFDLETEGAADSASDDDGYDNIGLVRHRDVVASRSAYSSTKDIDSLMVGYSTAQRTAAIRNGTLMDQDSPASSVPRTSGKIVNISVNVNAWKPPNYEPSRSPGNVEAQRAVERKGTDKGKSNVRIAHVNDTSMTDKSKGLVHSVSQVEAQKALPAPVADSYSAGQPQGDVDSRTVFVSNVHFAATKDALSRHFNKFGAVLKVIIVTDGATGQPTGSAYIEFLHKESAEQALSLNGTSFMSRILKVVRRSSHEVPQLPGWPNAARGSPFASRLIRTAYPRPVLPGAVRGRLPLIVRARSLQWKRDAADSPDAAKSSPGTPVRPGNQLVSPTPRSFTYTRTEPKPNEGATT